MRTYAHLVVLAATTICLPFASGAGAQTLGAGPGADPYVQCNFRPQADSCEALLKNTQDSHPAADSVKAAFQSYGRYLRGPGPGLTDDDRRYLADNAIRLPDDLNSTDLNGLHNVINDPGLANDAAARRRAVNGFLTRAVAAELYCGFNACGA